MTEAPIPSPTPPLEMAHVLFMDIVAYSTLHMDRQQQLLHELQEAVRSTPTFFRAQAQEQLIRLPTGDGMALVFFQDPEAPVRCALELAKALCGNPDLKLRMGIHTGPVYRVADINANRNVAGGGINIAQRVMDCGDAGHILVSSAEAEVLGQVSVWCSMLHDLGEVEVKHGLRIHLYNLYSEEAGSPAVPKKISAQRAASSLVASDVKKRKFSLVIIAGIAALALASLGGWLFYAHKAHALSATDTIVLGDFTNKTGDSIFDDTLRQGLAVQLEQSPFLSLISEDRIQQTLRLMQKPPDSLLTLPIARELCQRTASKAYIGGSIASLGNSYVVGLNAVNCATGDSLAHEQVQAKSKENVLDALGTVATKLRERLGESLSTVQKFDTPLEQATTPSLEALQLFSVAQKTVHRGDISAALPLFQRAIRLDPNFAVAYAWLGIELSNLGETNQAADNIKKAYELRERVSEREKVAIESFYHDLVTGDLERARQAYELWAQTYPRDKSATQNLGNIYMSLGQHDRALAKFRESLRADPGSALVYPNIANALIALGRFEEARATLGECQAKGLDSISFRMNLYSLAFLQNDTVQMAQQLASAAGQPGYEDSLMASAADTDAYFGRLREARELTRRAVILAEHADEKESAAGYESAAALREAHFGKFAEAGRQSEAAVRLSTGRDVVWEAAQTLAFLGNSAKAQALAHNLADRFPQDTAVQFTYIPTIRAQLALNRNDPSTAVSTLQVAAPYELAIPSTGFLGGLNSVYVRGVAYLALGSGSRAAAEFEKILNHRGIVGNDSIGALAHLGLARARVLQGDTAKARAAYQDFLTLWKDADPDIPILKQAKVEYAKLQ